MNLRQLTAYIPDEGEVGVDELASLMKSDSSDVAEAVRGLEEYMLVKVAARAVSATDYLRKDRESGILPPCAAVARLNMPLSGCENRVFEHIVLFGGSRKEVASQCGVTSAEAEAALKSLSGRQLIRKAAPGRWRLISGDSYVADESYALECVRRRYSEAVTPGSRSLHVRTKVDVLVDLADAFSPLSLRKAAAYLGAREDKLLFAAETLHERGILGLKHKGGDSMLLRGGVRPDVVPQEAMESCVTEKYTVASNGVSLDVHLVEEDGESKYVLKHPVFQAPTEAMLERLYDAAGGAVDGEVQCLRDFEDVKRRLSVNITALVDERMPFVDEGIRRILAADLSNLLRLGRIEYLLRDPNIEEIKAHSGRKVYVKHVSCPQEWVESNITLSEAELARYAKAIARETGQQVDSTHPLLDAVLHTKDRVNVSMPETSGGAYVIEVRVFSKRPWNFVRLISRGAVTSDVMALIWLAVQYRLNILVSGETGSGKTSFLTALALFLPKNDHIVSVEDTRELQLPDFFGNWTHLTVRRGEGAADVTMSRLLVNALRMNPSSIIMGEVRTQADIAALMQATAMGHPVMSTIHTRDCSTTVKRFQDADVHPSDLANIHLNVILESVRSKDNPLHSRRRVKEVGEYLLAGSTVDINRVYRMDLCSDTINQVNEPRAYYQRITDKAGFTKDEIRENLSQKRMVIEWLVAQKADDISVIGRVVQEYYGNPGRVLHAALFNTQLGVFLNDKKQP